MHRPTLPHKRHLHTRKILRQTLFVLAERCRKCFTVLFQVSYQISAIHHGDISDRNTLFFHVGVPAMQLPFSKRPLWKVGAVVPYSLNACISAITSISSRILVLCLYEGGGPNPHPNPHPSRKSIRV